MKQLVEWGSFITLKTFCVFLIEFSGIGPKVVIVVLKIIESKLGNAYQGINSLLKIKNTLERLSDNCNDWMLPFRMYFITLFEPEEISKL